MGPAGLARTMHHTQCVCLQCTCDDNARACIHGHTRGLIARAAFIYFLLGWSAPLLLRAFSAHQARCRIRFIIVCLGASALLLLLRGWLPACRVYLLKSCS